MLVLELGLEEGSVQESERVLREEVELAMAMVVATVQVLVSELGLELVWE